ncbi:carboxypeptidase M32 [Geoglobus acetivorans]|uniref:Metal-dependent carboxypeptidase n=1 Tax=Geoglobus acetivorans TaxID=565033 RepID=A0A0A7GAP1_GEOAI|nr:carboxypeptidase [Geoglobus acetivorans]
MGEVFQNELVKELVEKYRVLWAINHAKALMAWDNETYMPKGGVGERAMAMANLSTLEQKLMLDPDFVSLLERAEGIEDLNEYERGVLRVLRRNIDYLRKIPPEIVFEIAKTSQEAVQVWDEAKRKNDFEKFRPYLEKLSNLAREVAEKLGYDDNPYSALLDLHEEGLDIKKADRIFDKVIPASKKILEKVREDDLFPDSHPLEEVKYETTVMEKVNRELLDLLGYSWERGRLDVSPHPFTITLGIGDVRITTRYEGFDFKRAMFSTIHEFGHALYELQVDERLKMSPIAGGVSLGIHESQSRLMENIVGRSRAFVSLIRPLLEKHLDFVRDYDDDELYRYFNTVKPGLIRVDADELTYNFHIYLRYKLEKLLIAGEIGVDDLPELWNEEMENLLGIRPTTYSEGVLQDIHWSHASFGYFPSYTLGNVVAGQIWTEIVKVIDFEDTIQNGKFEEIYGFLKERIHRWGGTYSPQELLKRNFGRDYDPESLIAYLRQKYTG